MNPNFILFVFIILVIFIFDIIVIFYTLHLNKRYFDIKDYFVKKKALSSNTAVEIEEGLLKKFPMGTVGKWGIVKRTDNNKYWFDLKLYEKRRIYRLINIVAVYFKLFLLGVLAFLLLSLFIFVLIYYPSLR